MSTKELFLRMSTLKFSKRMSFDSQTEHLRMKTCYLRKKTTNFKGPFLMTRLKTNKITNTMIKAILYNVVLNSKNMD